MGGERSLQMSRKPSSGDNLTQWDVVKIVLLVLGALAALLRILQG
jgi:hypothetical protein